MKIGLVDYGKTTCTNEVLSILEAVLEEAGFPSDNAVYAHMTEPQHLLGLGDVDVVVAMGAEAMRKLCNVTRDLKEYAGCLTWNEDMARWVLPTYHPNGIYQEKYDEFDFIYAHVRRAVDLATGRLAFPSKEGPDFEWEFIGHNGVGWDWKQGYNPVVWSGYDEVTPEQADRAILIFTQWLEELDVL